MKISPFPPKCVFCGCFIENKDFKICSDCLEKISFNNNKCKICGKPLDTVYGEKICHLCRKRRRVFVQAFVPLIYKDDVRKSIHRFKFQRHNSYAKTFAALIFIEIKKSGYIPDVVTYVPIHFIRYGTRGYNQSALVACELAKMLDVPCVTALRKIKNTQPLYSLSVSMRLEAVSGAFAPSKKADVKNKHILLVDDILTTGTTVVECSKILKKIGASEVSIAAIAAVE